METTSSKGFVLICVSFVALLCQCGRPPEPVAPVAQQSRENLLKGSWQFMRGRAVPELTFEGNTLRRYGRQRVVGNIVQVEATEGIFTYDGETILYQWRKATCRLTGEERNDRSEKIFVDGDRFVIGSDIYMRVPFPTERTIQLGCFTGDRFFATGLNPLPWTE